MDTSFYTDISPDIPAPSGKYAGIDYIVIDVDGTMTDGGIYYDENGNELKKFNTKDAAGFFAVRTCGIKTLMLTGRKCQATARRAKELQVDFLEQEVLNKPGFLLDFMKKHDVEKNNIAYLGDDLNDYSSMKLAGFIGCPRDAVPEIIKIADYVSGYHGGQGAVRDIMRYLLLCRGQWDAAVRNCYRMGV